MGIMVDSLLCVGNIACKVPKLWQLSYGILLIMGNAGFIPSTALGNYRTEAL